MHTRRLSSARATAFGRVRGGFTLIELLVVIAMIAVLVSLLSGGVQQVRKSMNLKATDNVVGRLQVGLDDQMKAIVDMVLDEQKKRSNEYVALVSYCDNDQDRAAALLMYCRLRQYFPITATDLATPSFTVGGVTFFRPLGMQQLNGLNGDPTYVSAAILHAAMSNRTLGGRTFDVETGLNGAQTEVGPPNLTGAKRVFEDAWGKPVGFAFITQAQVPDLALSKFTNPNSAYQDPFDPQGKLATWASPKKAAAEAALGLPAGWFSTQNKALVAYSMGANGVADANFGGDDVLGHRTRAIAARGTK